LKFSQFQIPIPLLVGLAAFLVVQDFRILDPTYTGWLAHGDMEQHQTGWEFFRHSDWSFPIGMNPRYGLEISGGIVYSDSNPLLAIVFKALRDFLPDRFQYFGWWTLLCYLLQAVFAWKLLGLVTRDAVLKSLALPIFVLAPPFLIRMNLHLNLAAHFLVLAPLYMMLRSPPARYGWWLLQTVAAMINPYLLFMGYALWAADLITRLWLRQRTWRETLVMVAGSAAIFLTVNWQIGNLSAGLGASAAGYGLYRFNLLGFFQAQGWSRIIPSFPVGPGDYEGASYLGFGVILLGLLALALKARWSSQAATYFKDRPWYLAAALLVFIFALSQKVGVAGWTLFYPVPEPLLLAANVFRSSGRFIWPAYYALILGIVFAVQASLRSPIQARWVMAVGLLVQFADISGGMAHVSMGHFWEPRLAWTDDKLNSAAWQAIGDKYHIMRRLPPGGSAAENWRVLDSFALKHNFSTDIVYLARINNKAEAALIASADALLASGKYDADTVYIIGEQGVNRALYSLDKKHDALLGLNGMNVLVPGWNDCEPCRVLAEPLKKVDTEGKTDFAFSTGHQELEFLGKGWSSPEDWGTWSEGRQADVLLPVPRAGMHKAIFTFGALVTPGHPAQHVKVTIDGVAQPGLNITRPDLVDYEFELPAASGDAGGFVKFSFELPDAASPAQLGLNDDNRMLAIGLHKIKIQ